MAKEAWSLNPRNVGGGTGVEVKAPIKFPRVNLYLAMFTNSFIKAGAGVYESLQMRQKFPLNDNELHDLAEVDPGELSYDRADEFARRFCSHYFNECRERGFAKLKPWETMYYFDSVRLQSRLDQGDLRGVSKFYLELAKRQYKIATVGAKAEGQSVEDYAKDHYARQYSFSKKLMTDFEFEYRDELVVRRKFNEREPDIILPSDNFVMSLRMAAVFAREIVGR